MIPTSNRTSTHQPTLTTVELSLKDGLRSLGAHFQMGAHWLVDDVGPRLAERAGPLGSHGKLHKWHGLLDSAARQTLQRFESAQHRAAAALLDDAAYRALEFRLLPLPAYLASGDSRNPSGLFAEVFYWLIRHALTLRPDSESDTQWLVHQRLVDHAFWQLGELHAPQEPQTGAGVAAREQAAQDHASLCARLLQAFLSIPPVRDATMPPWLPHGPQDAATPPQLLRILLAVVLAAGSVVPARANPSNAGDCLRLGDRIATARLAAFEAALQHPAAQDALAAEFAFVFRHVHPC